MGINVAEMGVETSKNRSHDGSIYTGTQSKQHICLHWIN